MASSRSRQQSVSGEESHTYNSSPPEGIVAPMAPMAPMMSSASLPHHPNQPPIVFNAPGGQFPSTQPAPFRPDPFYPQHNPLGSQGRQGSYSSYSEHQGNVQSTNWQPASLQSPGFTQPPPQNWGYGAQHGGPGRSMSPGGFNNEPLPSIEHHDRGDLLPTSPDQAVTVMITKAAAMEPGGLVYTSQSLTRMAYGMISENPVNIHQSRGNNVGNNAVRNASQVKASAKKTTAMSDSQQRYLPHFNNGLEPNVHMNWKQSTKKAEKCDICDVQAKGRETHQRCADCHHVICRACCEAGGVARFTGHAWVDPNTLCWGTSLWSDGEIEYKPAKSRKATAAKRTVQRKQDPRSGPASGRGRGRGYGYGYGNRNRNRRVVPSLEDEPFNVDSNQDEEADYPMEDLVYGPSKSRKPRKSVPEAPRAKAQAPVVSSDDDFVPTPLPDYSSDEEAMPRKRVRLSGDSPSPEPQPQPWPRSLQRDASTPQLALGLANSRPVRASAIQTYEKMQRTQVVHDAPAARAIARRTPPRDSPTASSSKQKRSQGRNPAVVSSTKKASSSARGPSAYSPDAHPRNPFAPNPPRANLTQTEAIESPETAGRVQRSNAAKRQHGGNIRVPVQRQDLKPHNEDAFAASTKNDEALSELSVADHEHSDSLMSPSVSRALAPGSRANRNIDEEYDTDDQASVWSDGGKNNIAGDGYVTAASGDLEGAQGDIDSDGSEPVAAGGLDPSPSDEPLDVNNWPDTDHEYEIGFVENRAHKIWARFNRSASRFT
ncbi:hypothetical protein C8035_v011185 [Colletotrichum spinosum]|uniref:Uncharacterized protein n=1 Tax=Colletotrichum spinosum TaxID=1347390 RepID=A0A4R8Q5F8_9PEZI|nr:hypothetical protein C8035_v011185 [Colletotrichum spinosum]